MRGKTRPYPYKEIIMKQDENSAGYYRVKLNGTNSSIRVFVHRLVAEHFLIPDEERKVVNHIDGDKKNNSVENLEWVTQSENNLHSFYVLKNEINTTGINQKSPVLKIDKETGEVLDRYESIREASESNGKLGHISCVCIGRRRSAGGYYWKYAS